MIEARIAKIAMVGSLAAFALLVAVDNLVDYQTNFEFVRHVLSMDTTFQGTTLIHRRVTSPALWRAAYGLIIVGEALTGLALAIATLAMLFRARASATRFNSSKRLVFVGAAVGFLVWFFGFMVIGGEWFQMWQSAAWNGQEPAFRVYLTILAVLTFVNQPDGELRA